MPTMRDLNRYVIQKCTTDWEDIGLNLGLELNALEIIERNHPQQNATRLRKTLESWLELNPNATWRTLEVALTNVNRARLGLGPVDDVYGKDVYCTGVCTVI